MHGHRHENPFEWKLRWNRRWEPEPPRWRPRDLWILAAIALLAGLLFFRCTAS
jgi:hypothetical protein